MLGRDQYLSRLNIAFYTVQSLVNIAYKLITNMYCF